MCFKSLSETKLSLGFRKKNVNKVLLMIKNLPTISRKLVKYINGVYYTETLIRIILLKE